MTITADTKFRELKESGLDANDTAVRSQPLDISNNKNVAFAVIAVSGAHANHQFRLQGSLDAILWKSFGTALTGEGSIDDTPVNVKWVRLRETTAEGVASTVDIIIQAK